jgi:hypothetical protein
MNEFRELKIQNHMKEHDNPASWRGLGMQLQRNSDMM